MTTIRALTAAQALVIIADESAEFLPFRIINESGKTAVREWLIAVAKTENNDQAWFADAEQAANNAAPGETIIIEMRSFDTNTGRTETLRLDDSDFEWTISE